MVGGGGAAHVIRLLLEREEVSVGHRGKVAEGEAHHLRVRRVRDGEVVAIRDGAGLVGTGRLVRVGTEWEVEVESLERRLAPPELTLAVGAGDRERFGLVVEKAVEFGVTRLVPLETERTIGVATRVRPVHLAKLRRQALEAVKQSGNPWTCTIDAPVGLESFLLREPAAQCWLADPAGGAPPAALGGGSCAVIVGPEGGLTESERASAIEAGYAAVTLGPHMLRFETAAIAAAAVVEAARQRGMHG
jgi:16S rRNA (uracil1498-N3)-methyltransferase